MDSSRQLKPIDIHTHLSSEEFDTDRADVMSRAFEACSALIDIGAGTSPDAFHRARQLAESYENVYFTAGVHPHDAQTLGTDTVLKKEVEQLLIHPKCVAVGECGLDRHYDHSPLDVQMEVFKWQIELAERYQLPLMIHTREAEAETKELLKNYKGQAVFHCFTGTQDLANFGVSKNFKISFSGIITFKKAEDLRSVFRSLPLESIVIETDSPYLAPIPMRGKRNETSFLSHTAEFLARERNLPTTEFVQQTLANTRSLFAKLK
jgi:TatD DNase family protein